MTTESILACTRGYVAENFLYMRKDFELSDDDSLLDRGIIDSMGVIELVSFLEQEFGIQVGDTDITEENLGSLTAIARYVGSKREVVEAA